MGVDYLLLFGEIKESCGVIKPASMEEGFPGAPTPASEEEGGPQLILVLREDLIGLVCNRIPLLLERLGL